MQSESLPADEVVAGLKVGWDLSRPGEVLHEETVGPGAFSDCATDETLFEDLELKRYLG